jgi:hypothetical protein
MLSLSSFVLHRQSLDVLHLLIRFPCEMIPIRNPKVIPRGKTLAELW